MTLSRRASLFITTAIICILISGCGETFRPVVTPLPQPGPDPQGSKNAIVLSQAASGAGVTTHINLAGDTTIGQVQVGPGPVHAATFASGSRVAIANRTGDSVSLYSTSSPASQTVGTVSLPTGANPSFLAFNASTSNMFVAMSGLNAVGVVAVNSALFTNQINLGVPSIAPVALAVTPDGNRVYTANSGGTVTVIDARNLNTITTVSVLGSPNYVVSSANSAFVYVVNGAGYVSVINTADNSFQNVTVGSSPSFAVFDPRLLRVYVPNTGSNSLSIINADPNAAGFRTAVTVPVGMAPKFVTALADGSKAYVSNSGSANVSVINTLSNSVVNTITVGNNPANVISSTDSTKVAVLNIGSNSVTSIRTTDDAVTQAINLPANAPQGGPTLTPVYMISQQ
jgi:YVTN family beta-propeller protein